MSEAANASPGRTGSVSVRVRYPETDRMGVAYHAHYLVWFELGRTELMRELGYAYGELEDNEQIFFPVVEAGARYRSPARYDQVLDLTTRLSSVGGSRVRFEYRLVRRGEGSLVATGFTEHATVDADGKPRRLPRELRLRLQSAERAE